MVTGILLVGLAVACRLLSPTYHIWNFVPVGAVALYAGARLPRRWAWTIPLAAMILSDVYLDYNTRRPIFELTRWTVYLTLAATTALGFIARSPRVRPWMLPGLSVSASVLFFVTTNFATWAQGQEYPMTWSGLATCYVKGIPFFRPTLAADLLGTCVLFGLGPVFERAAMRVGRAWSRDVAVKPETADLTEVA
jgi:Family of unknown function (DUF6580)